MRNVLIWTILFAIFAFGCSNQSSSSEGESNPSKGLDNTSEVQAEEEIELTFFYPIQVGGPLSSIIEGFAEDFMEEYPHIKVNPVYTGDYNNTMIRTQTSIQGKNPPDFAVLLAIDLFTLLDMNAIVPMDEFIAEDSEGEDYINDFFPAFLENSLANDKIWSIPFQRSTPVLYYNKEAFAEVGLDPNQPPTNWNELVEYAQKLTVRGSNGEVERWGVEVPSSSNPWIFKGFVLQNGGILDEGGKHVYFNEPEVEEVLQFQLDLAHKYEVMPKGVIDWATTPSDFIEGKAAMIYHTTGNLTNIKDNAKFDFGVAYLPGNKQYGAPTGGGNFYIFEGIEEEKKQAAWKFIKWVTSPERAAQWSIDTGYVATRMSAYETDVMKEYVNSFPQAGVARDQLEYASSELSTHNNSEVTEILKNAYQAVLTGEKSPKEALETAQRDAERVLAPFQ